MGCSCSKSESPRHGAHDGHALPTLLNEQRREPQELLPRAKIKEVSCHASEGSKWHSELVSMSSDLKEKLQDPQFVASRCDLDGSGDLDPHELRQAARVYGISGSCKGFARHMAEQSRISKTDFADLVSRSQGSTKLIRTIPHSLRGMALGQLLHLEALFIKSGWLPAQCESFNRENATFIEFGAKFKQSPNLYALDTYVVTPMSKPGTCKARKHDHQQTITKATGKSSFSELVNPWGLWVHCFVSHFWGHDFSSTVTALELWAAHQNMTSEKLSLVFWICLFALNQHNVAEEVGERPQQGPFNAALAQASGGAVMVLDEEIKPFSRIWCLFEISRLKELQRPFELICAEGSLSQPQAGSQAVSTKMLRATCEALWQVSAAKAESSVDADKYQIWAETADSGWRRVIESTRQLNAHYHSCGEPWKTTNVEECCFSNFDHYMKSLLSSTMLQHLVASGEFAAAKKCCMYGAQFDREQLTRICISFEHDAERKDWLNSLLRETASDASVAQLLLELGADVEAARDNGWTALMGAAEIGCETVVKLLLEHGADVQAATDDGWTALLSAARSGCETVVKLLLDLGADLKAANGRTALLSAARSGCETVVKLLLEHGADVNAAMDDGETALMCAAGEGHVIVAQLLLELGADVEAARDNGWTALMGAADIGCESVVKLLLEHGADVQAADHDGETALMRAAKAEHEAVVKLLLRHGADVNAAETRLCQTALMRAAGDGHEAMVKLLLEHGADVEAAGNNGRTALMCAAGSGRETVVKLLLEHGADVNAAMDDGETALMCAAGDGHEAMVKLLLEHGADVNAADDFGETVLLSAVRQKHTAVVKLLLKHGADVMAADAFGFTAFEMVELNDWAERTDRERMKRLLRIYLFRRWLCG